MVKAKKKFGQNFLHDHNILNQIIKVSNIDLETSVIEIGPGTGNLTAKLLDKTKQVIAFEIDGDLIPYLNDRFKAYSNFTLVHADFLEVNLELYNFERLVIISNLPYYITSPIIFKILESNLNYSLLTFMMQEEVALRLISKPKSKDYGVLSVYCNTFCDIALKFRVLANCFTPAPSVNSAVVTFLPKKSTLDKLKFLEFLKLIFHNKRKTLQNNIKSYFTNLEIEAIFSLLKLNSNIRAEELDLDMIYKLFSIYSSIKRINALAKLNLYLNVFPTNQEYHQLESIVVPFNLYDTISIFKSDHLGFFTNKEILDNILIKTRDLYLNTFNISEKFMIVLDKQIPISSGLGGGSSDSSSLLLLLNSYFNKTYDLSTLAKSLGSDNLFFLNPKPAIMYDTGSKLEYLSDFPNLKLNVFIPNIYVSTKEVYRIFDVLGQKELDFNISIVLEALRNHDYSYLANNLMSSTLYLYPKLKEYIDFFTKHKLKYYMSGSGPSFFFLDLSESQKELIKELDGKFY